MTADKILHELHDLWVNTGQAHEMPGQAGDRPHGEVLRACTMTLFVLADEADDPAAIWELLAALMPQHPSRAILLRFRRGAGRDVNARVFAQCWQPFGQRRQICCEQVEISAGDGSVADLPPVLAPLAAPDLPVFLYCRCPRLFASPLLAALAGKTGKVVVDSGLYGDTPAALKMLAERAGQFALADLAWTRLTPWREAVSIIFEERTCLAVLSGAVEVTVAATGSAPSPEACYLTAWLLDGIAQAGGSATTHFEAAPGETAGEIRRVSLRGTGLEIEMKVAENGSAEIRVGGSVRRNMLPRRPAYTVLGEELSIPGSDPVYRKVLPAAARLAKSWSK